MKTTVAIAIDEELLIKARKKAVDSGISFSEFVAVALMAVVDKKALMSHTAGLCKQLSNILGENLDRKFKDMIGGELVEGSKLKKKRA